MIVVISFVAFLVIRVQLGKGKGHTHDYEPYKVFYNPYNNGKGKTCAIFNSRFGRFWLNATLSYAHMSAYAIFNTPTQANCM